MWHITKAAAAVVIQNYCGKAVALEKPEYENQRLLELMVLSKEQWCKAWGIPVWEYKGFVKMYERRLGKKLATPERRAQWEKEYWEKLG